MDSPCIAADPDPVNMFIPQQHIYPSTVETLQHWSALLGSESNGEPAYKWNVVIYYTIH